MPLLKLTNQPYFPDPNSPASLVCAGEYCYPINQGDPIYQQWYQTPCGQNEIADPTFSNASYGANLVTNGDFALPFAPDWTAVDWTLVSGQAQGPVLDAVNSLTQTVALAASSYYMLKFNLSGLSLGDMVKVYVGSTSYWYEFYDDGYYSELVMSGTDNFNIVFVAGDGNNANALIDNVELQLATFSDWDTNTSWLLNTVTGTACADGTGTGLLEEIVTDYIVPGDYYQMSFTVSGVTAGSFTAYVADVTDQAATVITANGDYTLYFSPTLTGVVSFLPSTDFVGCISAPDLRALRNDYTGNVVDPDGNEYNISEWIQYYEDKVYIESPLFDLLELTYDCYTIELLDKCLVEGIELVTNGDFALGYDDWTRNNGYGQYDLNAGTLEFVFEPLENGNIITNGDFASGSAGWTFAGWTIGTDATHNTGNTSPLSRSITIGTPAVSPNVRVTWIQLTVTGRTAGSFTVTLSDKTSASYSTNEVFTFPLIPTIGGVVTFSITPTSTFDGVIDNIQVYQSLQPWSAYASIRNVANADMVAGNYSISYDQTANDNPGNIETSLAIVGQTQSIVYNDTVATHTNSITGYVPGAQQVNIIAKFKEGNNYFPGRVAVDNVSAVRVEPFEATYVSECMNYQFEHPDTYILTGTCDQASFGFEFDAIGFKLQMRTRVRGLNPIYNVSKNIAQFGTGNAAVKYADQTKYWQLATDFISESAHDALSTIVNCDHFSIGTSTANAIEYVAEAEDYQPQWIQSGSYSLAPVTLNLRLKTGGQKFNRHT